MFNKIIKFKDNKNLLLMMFITSDVFKIYDFNIYYVSNNFTIQETNYRV